MKDIDKIRLNAAIYDTRSLYIYWHILEMEQDIGGREMKTPRYHLYRVNQIRQRERYNIRYYTEAGNMYDLRYHIQLGSTGYHLYRVNQIRQRERYNIRYYTEAGNMYDLRYHIQLGSTGYHLYRVNQIRPRKRYCTEAGNMYCEHGMYIIHKKFQL